MSSTVAGFIPQRLPQYDPACSPSLTPQLAHRREMKNEKGIREKYRSPQFPHLVNRIRKDIAAQAISAVTPEAPTTVLVSAPSRSYSTAAIRIGGNCTTASVSTRLLVSSVTSSTPDLTPASWRRSHTRGCSCSGSCLRWRSCPDYRLAPSPARRGLSRTCRSPAPGSSRSS